MAGQTITKISTYRSVVPPNIRPHLARESPHGPAFPFFEMLTFCCGGGGVAGGCDIKVYIGQYRPSHRNEWCKNFLWNLQRPSVLGLSLIHISEPTRLLSISYA